MSCHQGEETPQWELYLASPHSKVVEGKRVAECIDCHNHHHVSQGITLGTGGNGATIDASHGYSGIHEISRDTFANQREIMIDNCKTCHADTRILNELTLADSIKVEADESLKEIIELVRNADNEGILTAIKAQHDRGIKTPFFTSIRELNTNASFLEGLLYEACKVAHPLIWKAAYHQSPSNIRKGRRDLDRLRREIVREIDRLRTDTLQNR